LTFVFIPSFNIYVFFVLMPPTHSDQTFTDGRPYCVVVLEANHYLFGD